jgi:uncharacterized protein YneR
MSNNNLVKGVSPLVPEDESLKENIVNKWINIDYGNSHKEWNAARLINDHNLKELNKIKLHVKVRGINFQVIRGSTVPVEISNPADQSAISYKEREDGTLPKINDSNDFVIDKNLSAAYYVQGAKYVYDKLSEPNFYTEYFLTRREWRIKNK